VQDTSPPATERVAARNEEYWLMEEIRRAPVEVGSLSHYLQSFKHSWCRISSINQYESTKPLVVQSLKPI